MMNRGLLCLLSTLGGSLSGMELPSNNRIPSLKLLALKQVYRRDKMGGYSENERACMRKMLAQESVRPLLHDIVDADVFSSEFRGKLTAYASDKGLVSQPDFWNYSKYSFVKSLSADRIRDLDSAEYRSIEKVSISPDGQYCVLHAWNADDRLKLFALDIYTGEEVFSSEYPFLGSIGFITESCFFMASAFRVEMVDLSDRAPQVRTIINNQQHDLFREVCSLDGEWLIARGLSRLFLYKKENSLANWQFSKMLRTPAIQSLAVGHEKPVFAQFFSKKSKDTSDICAAFYCIVEGSIRYHATCRVARKVLNVPPTVTFFDHDRYCACAVSVNQWFNQSRVMLIDCGAQGKPTVVREIVVESHPEKLFSDGPLLYIPSGIGSTDVLAVNNWLLSQKKKSDTTLVAKKNAYISCSIL